MGGSFGCCGGLGGFGAYGSIGWIIGLVLNIGLIIGVVLLAIWIVRRLSANGGAGRSMAAFSGGQPSAQEILQARYARGEIDREQYQQMLSDLG